MFSDLDLVELVKAEMADLMARHGLELAVIGKGEVLLRRTDYAIKRKRQRIGEQFKG
ncbi:hypothetical protein [Nitrospirillum viridazoti]|uniref:hypothetical protein n=1 Tax=Nitrospirillum viridazoti TaxID=3144925 RepID=UPI0011AD34EF|nr:hypothetical protein [Nitrospirillum amazonense]TWB26476.1 hypothetical protein FBZ91_1411 [Nitrospirillum amazonense]